MFTFSSKHRSTDSGSFSWVWSAEKLSSLKLRPGGLNYSFAPRWSNRSIAGSYIRAYEIKRLLDNRNISRQLFIVDVDM